jgi:hypothetical protein
MAEAERTGVIIFLNTHDYISDLGGHEWRGCMASIKHDAGETLLYTTSQRLQQALETAYTAKAKVTVSFADRSVASIADAKGDPEVGKWLSAARAKSGTSDGPFALRAIWTSE